MDVSGRMIGMQVQLIHVSQADMEYPRLGLIHIESFDHFLADAYAQMQ